MTPVSNTTPLIHLARIEKLALLRVLYRRVLVPPAVVQESRRHVAGAVADALAAGWLEERSPQNLAVAEALERSLGGRGEAEAIALALETAQSVLLVDERAARDLAHRRGLRVRGSLGVLIDAKHRGHVNAVRPLLDRLRASGFWLDDRTYAAALELAAESQ